MIFSKPKAKAVSAFAIDAQNINVFHGAKSFYQQLLTHIAQAKQRIYLCALYLQDDEAGQTILQALADAKQQTPSLEIKVFVDYHRAQRGLIGEQASSTNRDAYQAFEQKYQLSVPFYGVAVKQKELFGVLHLKGFVFDDTVFYSGASLNNVYLQQHEKYRCDRYYQLQHTELAQSFCQLLDKLAVKAQLPRLEQPQNLTKKQLKQVIKRTQYILQHHHYSCSSLAQLQPSLTIKPLLGFGAKANELNDYIRRLIHKANNELVIFTPYFNLPKPLLAEVKKALKRGVNIQIVVGDKTANDFYIADPDEFSTVGIVPYLYEQMLGRFIKRFQRFIDNNQLDIRLWRDHDNSFHLKGIVADNRWHLITGNNLNPRAWRLDAENGLLIKDDNRQLEHMWQAELAFILQHTTTVTSIDSIEGLPDYPEPVQKLLKNIHRSQISRLLQRFL